MRALLITELFPKTDSDITSTEAIYNLVKEWDHIYIIRPYYVLKFSPFIINIKRKPVYTTRFNDLQILHVPVFKIPVWKKFIFPNPQRICFYLQAMPDIVIGHFLIGNRMAYHFSRKLKVPFTIGLHNTDIRILKKRGEKYDEMLANASKIICRSESIKKRLLSVKTDLDPDKIYIANSGIKSDIIESPEFFEAKKTAFLKKKKISFITVARLIPLKNIDINLKVLASNHEMDWEYIIVGDGQERKKLEALVKTLDLTDKVTFTGWLLHKEIMQYLKGADVFLQVSAPETFGLVYLEALAKGCILIGAKGWGIDGIIKNNINGFLANPRDMNDLTLILKEKVFSENKEYLSNFYNNMYQTIIKLSEKKQSQAYQECIIQSTFKIQY